MHMNATTGRTEHRTKSGQTVRLRTIPGGWLVEYVTSTGADGREHIAPVSRSFKDEAAARRYANTLWLEGPGPSYHRALAR